MSARHRDVHTALERLAEDARGEGVRIDQDAIDRLARFVLLVQEWSARVNLVSRREIDRLVEKHVAPSLAPLMAEPFGDWPHPGAGNAIRGEPDGPRAAGPFLLADVGSGGGFPGMVLALVRPRWSVVLIEPVRKKALFLERASREAPNARVERARAESAATTATLGGSANLITARALGAPAEVWPLVSALLARGGEVHVFVAAGRHDALAAEARSRHGDLEVLTPLRPSFSRGAILRMRAVDAEVG